MAKKRPDALPPGEWERLTEDERFFFVLHRVKGFGLGNLFWSVDDEGELRFECGFRADGRALAKAFQILDAIERQEEQDCAELRDRAQAGTDSGCTSRGSWAEGAAPDGSRRHP